MQCDILCAQSLTNLNFLLDTLLFLSPDFVSCMGYLHTAKPCTQLSWENFAGGAIFGIVLAALIVTTGFALVGVISYNKWSRTYVR